jgi:hypothetical protein
MMYRLAALVPLALAGCTEPLALPEEAALIRAADPSVVSPAPSGPGVGYTRHTIAEPMDWRQLNDAQAPGGGA